MGLLIGIDKTDKRGIGKIIGIMSGKGGVGKSTVTSLSAIALTRKGYRVGIMDADVTGPSIPKMFGMVGRIVSDNDKIIPAKSEKLGISVVSLNLMLENEDNPVIWRGPLLSGVVMQFWNDTNWGDLDYLLIDMPPGTGDIPLSIMQFFPLDGMVVVTTPQAVAKLIVAKSVNMARTLDIPIFGAVENMGHAICPDCGKRIKLFGNGDDATTEGWAPKVISMPADPAISKLADEGKIEEADAPVMEELASIYPTI